MHWTCAYQQENYPHDSHDVRDARLLISFAIYVLGKMPMRGIKAVFCPVTAPHDRPTVARVVDPGVLVAKCAQGLGCRAGHAQVGLTGLQPRWLSWALRRYSPSPVPSVLISPDVCAWSSR